MHFQPSRRAIMLSRVSRVSRAWGTLTLIVWAVPLAHTIRVRVPRALETLETLDNIIGRLGSKGDRGMGVWVSMGNSVIKMLNLKK
jgi:hypothetical protein